MALETVLIILSSAFFLAAIYFSAVLSRETKGEKYWFFFLVTALAFGAAHVVSKFSLPPELREVAEIAGAFSLAYACYGLYASMKKFRAKMGDDL